MNLPEGARRMQTAGRTASVAGVAVLVVGLTVGLLLRYTDLGINRMAGEPVMLTATVVAGYILFPGSLLWLAGWILEGFASPNRSQLTDKNVTDLAKS